jgi:uncharacterized glyoxalase superfamily protein PhnB
MTYLGGWDRPDGKGALLSAGGTAVVEIYGVAEDETCEGPQPMAINLALCLPTVTDVDSFHTQLVASGAQIASQPVDRPWGHRSFIVHDPDEIPIHIYCELSAE